jgi:hypothetical protein
MQAVVFLAWIAASMAVAAVAHARGRHLVSWFFIAVFASPVIACAVVTVMPRKARL